MIERKYIRLDGDKIGDKIELSLLNEDFDKAQNIHDKVQNSLQVIRDKIKRNSKMEILMYGSDDILFWADKDFKYREFLNQIKNEFFEDTNCTLSIGVGNTIISSINNLRRAKLSGRNKIEE